MAEVSFIRPLVCWIGEVDSELLLDPGDVSERELLFIGAGLPPALVILAPIVVKLLEALAGVIPMLYDPVPLPLPPLPSELEYVLEPVDGVLGSGVLALRS